MIPFPPMRLDWLVPARDASVRSDGTIDVRGGGVDTLVVDALGDGVEVQVVLAMRIAGEARDWHRPHDIDVTLQVAANCRPVFVQRLALPEAQLLEPQRDVGMLLAVPCRWSVVEPGTAELVVRLNGERLAQLRVNVIEDATISLTTITDPPGRLG